MRAKPGQGNRYAYKKLYYQEHQKEIQEKVKMYYFSNHERCKARQRELQRLRRRTDPIYLEREREHNRLNYRKHHAWYMLRNAKQSRTIAQRARMRLQYLTRIGKVLRPTHCEGCQKPCKPHGHHYRGYKVPERVIWLCRMCHAELHHR